jgi:tetratricopeptide (TPR) repeat protein
MGNRIVGPILGLSLIVVCMAPTSGQEQSIPALTVDLPLEQIAELNRLISQAGTLAAHEQYADAKDIFEKALKACPKSSREMYANILCNIGGCCFYCGDTTKAQRVLNEAVKFDPNDPAIAYNLANCYIAQGNTKKARLWLHKCINDHQDPFDFCSQAKLMLATLNETTPGSGARGSTDYLDDLSRTNSVSLWLPKKIPLRFFLNLATQLQIIALSSNQCL